MKIALNTLQRNLLTWKAFHFTLHVTFRQCKIGVTTNSFLGTCISIKRQSNLDERRGGSKMSALSTSGLIVELLLRVIDVKYGYFTLLYDDGNCFPFFTF